MTKLEELITAAEALSEDERLRLIDSLLESVQAADRPVDEEWARIIVRRGREIDRGAVNLLPMDDVFEEARRLLDS